MSPTEIQKFLHRAGLEPDAAKIFLVASKAGPTSALQLAKATGVARTQVYRHLEALQEFGLISREQLSYGTLFRPLGVENLEATIASREAETAALKSNLSNVATAMRELAGASGATTNVVHHYGLAGIKQANWNLTKADKEFFVFEVAHLNDHLDKTFARRHRERVMERQLVSHDLTNASVVTAKELAPVDVTRSFYRHIDPEILTINFEVYLYNDVVTLLDYSADNMHALEIHHPSLHAMMQQLYDAMWRLATPLEIK